ncbi:hypothetical protein [Actinomadura rupiterrae]|uniref:hypothetical protein n=1 Tax=Actinomadura rupiterrae TaxID=559627 RepID=UPI0020A4A8B0|nr:hypothetical protein [Actinomadura rupiterrae]MCP2338228.1 hypothetical protein [Actinomadura rupiterrae]
MPVPPLPEPDERPPAKARNLSWTGEDVAMRPVGPADAAAWKADGSPDRIKLNAGEPDRSIGPERSGGPVLDFGDAAARRLPTDPAKLRAALLNYALSVGHERVPNPDEYLYRSASFLLVDTPVRDDLRIATYRLLASLRGVRTVTTQDATGVVRQGVALRTTTPEYGTVDSELLIDPRTGRLVAGQEVVVKPGPRTADLRPGVRWRYEIVRYAGWTNRPAESLLYRYGKPDGPDGPPKMIQPEVPTRP